MPQITADKITALNKVTLESLGEHNKLVIVKKFTEASIDILDADFGFAWWRQNVADEYKLVYKSDHIPYEPNPPRKRGGNYKAQTSGAPVFVPDTSKEVYSKQYDVRPYMKSYVIIPIAFEGNFYGNIVLCYEKKKSFNPDDHSLAGALGNALAQALTISRLYGNLKNFQQTVDSALDSIFIFDSDNLKIVYANEGAVAFSGMKRQDILGKTLSETISGLSHEELLEKITDIQKHPNKPNKVFESTYTHPVKGKIPIEVHLQHIVRPEQQDQFLVFVRDITDRVQAQSNITKMAYYDTVTGIPNRALLNERLIEEHERAKTENGMYAMFFIDLDRFKIINDIYGHHVGDNLLKEVAKRLSKVIPKKATVARMGGDEFLVLLPNIKAVSEAEKCAKEILEIFTQFFQIDDHELYANGSVGFAIFPLDGIDYHVVMKNADLALNRAKEHGGANIQQYRVGQPLFYTMQPKLQSQLRQAIKKEELELHYQPIINVKTQRITSCESLIRWNHPEMGLLYPTDFIGQAEESGLIVEIGEWVFEEVCKQIQAWGTEGHMPPPVSINVSPRELLRPTLVSNMERILKKYKVSASQIQLELTETFLMKNIDMSIAILEQLKALGLKILIDDFGTGYASLNYLRMLPINGVKIDQSFIKGVPGDLQDTALTSAIIAISHQLGLDVVAEGVESLAQFEFLRDADCNFAQGNFFFKAVDADQFADMLHLTHST
jgi:diguanylate cyclase (GGDEF)-like protein/PAS domain S-box-containing protein